ncbi:hypothetical protein B0T10DRAFT_493804 [Thelonectria olida]|uniref:Zn(2)-C6 fungal-type domain-containing protein n=1 Tax=Thelonectria olida TaxID=1576542 RepID=A0A9P9AIP2_9HYPO|nr:hypothetical protein B0T10DRAFT_493804 [Thelonectria olida]
MVFSGRPSTACEPCRKWRLRCDRAVPTCTQCIRKKLVCSGYRDPGQLRLRNETERVTLKHQPAKKKAIPIRRGPKPHASASNASSLSENSEVFGAEDATCASVVPYTPSQPEEYVALSYFMNAYIASSAFEKYLPEMSTSSSAKGALSMAIHAAAFAALAVRNKNANYMKTARASYTQALVQTNTRLASPKDAILDHTLAAVLVLGLFEAISFSDQQSPESWTTHTNGAVQLLRLRGSRQFQSSVASQMFLQTMINIRTSCIQRAVPVPEECVKLDEETAPFLKIKDPALRIGPIIDRAAVLRERALKTPGPGLIFEAMSLDRETIELSESLGPTFRITTRPKQETPPWAYLGIAHRYPSHRATKFWNALRMIRLFLNELAGNWAERAMDRGYDFWIKCEEVSHLPFDLDYLQGLQTRANNNIAELAIGVLGSVPDFIEEGGLGTNFSLSARTLIWPLTVLYKCDRCEDLAKKYAVKFLYELGKDLNLAQAIDAASKAGAWRVQEDWLSEVLTFFPRLHLYHLQ